MPFNAADPIADLATIYRICILVAISCGPQSLWAGLFITPPLPCTLKETPEGPAIML